MKVTKKTSTIIVLSAEETNTLTEFLLYRKEVSDFLGSELDNDPSTLLDSLASAFEEV